MTTDDTDTGPPEVDPRAAALIDAAGELLHQAEDAASFVPLDELDVDDAGNIDPRQARWLVEKLAAARPYLARPGALPPPRRVVDFDAGARPPVPPPGPSVTERIRHVRDNGRGELQSPELLSKRFAPGRHPGHDKT